MNSCIPANPLLTVVVPTLNSARTLDWTLASLSASSAIRVIVVDSHSEDGTTAICRRWNVETLTTPPGNMYRAVNTGLHQARTEWLTYVNSDDWVFTGSYLRMLNASLTGSADVVYAGADYVDENGRFIFSHRPSPESQALRILRLGHLPFCQPAAMFRRSVFTSLGGFDERYTAASDFDFFRRAAIGKHSFRRFCAGPVAAFRLHADQISARSGHIDLAEKIQMRERLHLESRLLDHGAFIGWRIANLSGYLTRALRRYQLFGRVTGTPRGTIGA